MNLQNKSKMLWIFGALLMSLGVIGFIIFKYTSKDTIKGAIVTNGKTCANIGNSILSKGGTAVEAALAALFCEGVSIPQSMGLGGGFLMTIYSKKEGRVVSLNARETAPEMATQDMFKGDADLSKRGGLSVAVPGELRGYWYAYNRYGGKVSWKDIVQPTIDLCKNGILITPFVSKVLNGVADRLRKDPGLREVYIDPNTNNPYKANEYVKRLRLARSLEIIAEEGGDALHNGSLTKRFVDDIQAGGGIITVNDLNNYRPEWQEPIKVNLPLNNTLYTAPLPGSGLILGFIINILKGDKFLDTTQKKLFTNWQRIIESFKYGYGKRTELGDPNFVNISQLIANLTSPEYADKIRDKITDDRTFSDPAHYGANTTLPNDHGTAHISVLAPNGDAVSVTSTINLYFGAAFMSLNTGIILNDEMDDFSSPNITNDFNIPPSEANYIKAGKRPLSSMCPTIVLDRNENVKLIVGSAGGSKITTSVALVLIKHLWFGIPIMDAIFDKRLHHQLFPMAVQLEKSYQNETEFLSMLKKVGHNYTIADDDGFSAVTAISVEENDSITASWDRRRPGEEVYIY